VAETAGTPAVVLDRDGTLLEEAGYLDRAERAVVYPWSIDAVRLLNRAGFRVVVVTNQAGVARGFFDEAFVRGFHDHLGAMFTRGGAAVDGWYYCPHHPDASVAEYRVRCECRKPSPGMLRQAARDLALDLSRSFVVGDRWLDVQLGQNVGAQGILVRTGYGATQEAHSRHDVTAAVIVNNLIDAAGWILCRGTAGRVAPPPAA
jgi:D-glycero-D-manno-heptose 1,7-bisphosphate phosphatase